MVKGVSLHIGLNRVDSTKYLDEHGQPWSGALSGCENDARDMKALAQSRHLESRIILSETATSDRVLRELRACVARLDPGDILFLSYSGHGSQVPDEDNDERDDALDETWLLYDRQMLDDEIFSEMSHSASDARILMLSDSCHSGTVNRFRGSIRHVDVTPTTGGPGARGPGSKSPSREFALADYQRRRDIYRLAAAGRTQPEDIEFDSTILLISGCQDNQLSGDGPENGVFTGAVLDVWNQGAFASSYRDFYGEIVTHMPVTQRPNLNVIGKQNDEFVAQVPFTI